MSSKTDFLKWSEWRRKEFEQQRARKEGSAMLRVVWGEVEEGLQALRPETRIGTAVAAGVQHLVADLPKDPAAVLPLLRGCLFKMFCEANGQGRLLEHYDPEAVQGLPFEVLAAMFSYLPTGSLAQCRLVCRSFAAVAELEAGCSPLWYRGLIQTTTVEAASRALEYLYASEGVLPALHASLPATPETATEMLVLVSRLGYREEWGTWLESVWRGAGPRGVFDGLVQLFSGDGDGDDDLDFFRCGSLRRNADVVVSYLKAHPSLHDTRLDSVVEGTAPSILTAYARMGAVDVLKDLVDIPWCVRVLHASLGRMSMRGVHTVLAAAAACQHGTGPLFQLCEAAAGRLGPSLDLLNVDDNGRPVLYHWAAAAVPLNPRGPLDLLLPHVTPESLLGLSRKRSPLVLLLDRAVRKAEPGAEAALQRFCEAGGVKGCGFPLLWCAELLHRKGSSKAASRWFSTLVAHGCGNHPVPSSFMPEHLPPDLLPWDILSLCTDSSCFLHPEDSEFGNSRCNALAAVCAAAAVLNPLPTQDSACDYDWETLAGEC